MRPHQRMAARDHAGDQFVDEEILRAAQRRKVEPRGQEEVARIDPAAMRGVEQDRAAAFGRFDRLERGVEFVLDFQHDARRLSKPSISLASLRKPGFTGVRLWRI